MYNANRYVVHCFLGRKLLADYPITTNGDPVEEAGLNLVADGLVEERDLDIVSFRVRTWAD